MIKDGTSLLDNERKTKRAPSRRNTVRLGLKFDESNSLASKLNSSKNLHKLINTCFIKDQLTDRTTNVVTPFSEKDNEESLNSSFTVSKRTNQKTNKTPVKYNKINKTVASISNVSKLEKSIRRKSSVKEKQNVLEKSGKKETKINLNRQYKRAITTKMSASIDRSLFEEKKATGNKNKTKFDTK